MGCDIHLHVECLKTIDKVERWICIDSFKFNPYYKERNTDGERQYDKVRIAESRNYTLFSMLADVRNYANNDYICDPKGIPDDCSDYVKQDIERWDSDGHSHSYFTMQELYDFYESHSTVKHHGFVDDAGVASIEKGEMPEWWCARSSQPLIWKEWTYENTDMKWFIEELERYFKTEWYDKERDASKFRIVFFFDN